MVPGENSMLVPTQGAVPSPPPPPPPLPPPPPPPLPKMGSAGDEPRVLCIIRDMTNNDVQTKFTLNLPFTTSVREFITHIGQRLGYEFDTFIVSYEQPVPGPNGRCELEEVVMNEHIGRQLRDLCTHCGDRKRNNFNILEKDGMAPARTEAKAGDDLDVSTLTLGATASPVGESGSYSSAATSGTYGSALSADTYSYSSALIRSDTGYVGLVNQAMTCYLNSLLQTLYMSPEFRNAIYRWGFDGSEDEASRSIPYQLQRLFMQLQTSNRRAVETTDITKSFGWDSSESWQQHDVQELCRVMFDALEKKWQKTDQADLINQLYQGKMKDYVKCLECGYESARTDSYLDIPLVIRPFGSNTAYCSVEEALTAFIQPETLDGNNQYFCEICDKKCNAHKGLKFITFPYMLTLQLKRFDFDYTTMHRIKLNDRMTFPEILNLNHMIEGSEDLTDSKHKGSPGDPADPANPSDPTQQNHVEDADEGVDEGIDVGYSTSGTSVASTSDSSLNSTEAAANDKNAQDSRPTGPYVYELFSIMIHSGSAAGGHYYAYIKSFKDGQWYSFNDQQVSKITYEDITKTYGGSSTSRGYYSSAFTSSTNGYMLMYRQIDKEGNKDFMKVEDFPKTLAKELQKLRDKEEADYKQKELDRCTCKIKLFCFHPVHQKQVEGKLEVHKDRTLMEATEIAWKQLELDPVVPLDCVRLVRYNEFQDWVERSFDGEEDTPMGTLLGGVKSLYTFDLLLEVKRPEQAFQEYKPGGVTVKVYPVDLESETIGAPVTVRAYLNQTVADFKDLVTQMVGLPADRMRCVLERYYNELKLLLVPSKTLKTEGFVRSNKVFIECSGLEADASLPFSQTAFYKLLDRYENTIRIYISLPPFQKGAPLEGQVGVPSANEDPAVVNKSHDIDEGIDESDSDTRTESFEQPASQEAEGSGPLRSPALHASSPSSQSEVHSYISDSIHRNLADLALDGKQCDAPSTHTSAATSSSSQTTSPEDAKDLEERAAGVDPPQEVPATENWDLEETAEDEEARAAADEEYRRYFTGAMHIDTETGERNLTVYVDKRITFGAFKKELEAYVSVPCDYFRVSDLNTAFKPLLMELPDKCFLRGYFVYRIYGSNQEIETVRLTDTLSSFGDDNRLVVKLGRALRKGEHRVKVFLLQPNESEPWRLLLESIFTKGMTVLESKHLIIKAAKSQCNMDIPLSRCRVRKKSYKNPGNIYLDSQVYDEGMQVLSSWEIFLEVLDGPERLTCVSQLAVYVRQWLPSEYRLGPISELILHKQSSAELREKISELSGIPVENVDFAKGYGTFPCDVSLLDIHSDLDWSPDVPSLNVWPLHIYEDGSLLYFRDKTERLANLGEARKKELTQRENSRLSRISTKVTYSPRKERALKIYTDDPPPAPTAYTNPTDSNPSYTEVD